MSWQSFHGKMHMTQITPFSNGSSPTTTGWGFLPTSSNASSVTGLIYTQVTINLTEQQEDIHIGQSIQDLTAERAMDPRKAAALARARKRHSESIGDLPEFALAKLRLHKGLSQSQLAFVMGVSQPYIAKIERGEDDLRASTIRKLALALEMDASTLFGLLETKETKSNDKA